MAQLHIAHFTLAGLIQMTSVVNRTGWVNRQWCINGCRLSWWYTTTSASYFIATWHYGVLMLWIHWRGCSCQDRCSGGEYRSSNCFITGRQWCRMMGKRWIAECATTIAMVSGCSARCTACLTVGMTVTDWNRFRLFWKRSVSSR